MLIRSYIACINIIVLFHWKSSRGGSRIREGILRRPESLFVVLGNGARVGPTSVFMSPFLFVLALTSCTFETVEFLMVLTVHEVCLLPF
jgi:hypothetical protein